MIESERGVLSHLREDIAVAAQREAMIRGEHRLHVLHLRVQLRDRLRRREECVVLRSTNRRGSSAHASRDGNFDDQSYVRVRCAWWLLCAGMTILCP